MVSLKAHFDGRAIIPDEPIELPQGETLVVHVEISKPALTPNGSVLDWVLENAVDDPSVPADLSHQHDHYLYGTPRQ